MERRPLSALLAALAFLVSVGIFPACSGDKGEGYPVKPAPDFTLSSVDGQTIRLSDYQGKVVLIDFWATWCPPCRVAIPHLVELQKKYGDQGLVVLGLSLDMNPEDLTQFLSKTETNYPMLEVDEDTREAYGGVVSIPQTFVVDRKGQIRQKFMGYDQEIGRKVDDLIKKLLAEPPKEG